MSQYKCTKSGIKKSSFGVLGLIPVWGLPRTNSMSRFQHTIMLIFDKFLGGIMDVFPAALILFGLHVRYS